MNALGGQAMRPVILGTLVACLVVATAPWLSGGQQPVAMLLSGGALLLAALLAWRQPEVRSLRWGPLGASYALLMGLALLSLLWTVNRYSSAMWIAQWAMAGLAFVTAYVVAGERRGREWLLRAYLVTAGVFGVVAVGMFLTSDYDRLTGTFYWANPAAAYLIPAIILSLDRLRRAAGKMAWLWGAAAVFWLACFALTDSRLGTIVLAFVGVLYLIVVPTTRRYWIKIVFVLVLGWGLSLGLSWLSTITAQHGHKIVPGSRFAEAALGESKSGSDRLYYLGSAWQIWRNNPLAGTGAGTYRDVHPHYQGRVVSAASNAHNLYVQMLPELGIVGALALLAVVVSLYFGVLRGVVASPEMLPVALGLAGLLAHFGLDIDASYPALLALAGVLGGVVYRQWSPVRRRAPWLWPVVAALLMVPLVNLYQADVWAGRARAQQDDGDYATAAADFALAQRGVVTNPDYVNAEGIDWLTLAYAGGKGAYDLSGKVLGLAHEAQRSDPYDSQHYQLEGRAQAARGYYVSAEKAFRKALELDPYNHPDYASDLAGVQLQQGDAAGAVKTAQAMLAQYPPEVVADRNANVQLAKQLADLEAFVGNVYLKRGEVAQARAAAERGLALDKDNLRARALMHQVDKAQ